MNTKEEARLRAEMILKVRTGQITATQAAQTLGVSRKTYYEWEKRGLSAMLGELEDQEAGRPSTAPSATETALKMKVAELETQLKAASQTSEIRAILMAMNEASAKKKRLKPPKCSV
jgi:DNA-binding XRE family transcriptional regulator